MGILELKENKKNVEHLIKGWDEQMILACIYGDVGEIYVDSIKQPKSVQFLVGDFCFFAGIPNIELTKNKKRDFIIMTTNNEDWNKLIEEVYSKKYKKNKRYAIKKEKGIFDKAYLKNIVSKLDSKFKLKSIDEDLYKKVMKEEWSKDLCSNFTDSEDYLKKGFGVVILDEEEIISGASSYIAYKEAIEIEIDTKREYRRQGLALVAGAKLILECMDRGIYPSWDAANLWSVALAEKLGYHFSHEYIIYEIY